MELVCIVMAAGGARRFGGNKLLADFCGRPLFRWALDAVDPVLFSKVIVVTGYDLVAEAAQQRGFSVIRNELPEEGVSRTIRLGLEAAGNCDGALFMTADQPLLTGETLRKLVSAFSAAPEQIFAASHGGVRGNPCIFPGEFFSELGQLQGDTGGAAVIRRHPERLRLVETAAQELFDCDTPETMELCREKAAKRFQNYAKNDLTSL